MNVLIAFIVFAGCFAAMAIGLIIARKTLKKGCSVDPDACTCRTQADKDSCEK